MFRALTLAAPLAAALALPAAGFDVTAMTEAERAAFGAEVRAYLLENPGVLEEVIQALQLNQRQAQAEADRALVAANAAELFADGRSFVGGNPEGDVTMVEFLDYRCGYCRQAYSEVESLVETDGNIRFVIKEFPVLGEESVLAAHFAIATRNVAGPEAYKKVHDGLMHFRGEFSQASLRMFAMQMGLDAEAILAAMAAPEVEAEIAANYALAEKLRIRGTPGFVFGDWLERGYIPLENMREIIASVRG